MALSDLLLRLAALWGEQQMKKYELNQRLKFQKELMKLQEEMRQKQYSQQALQKRILEMIKGLVRSGKVTTPQQLYQYVLQQTGDPAYAREMVNQYVWLLDIARSENEINSVVNRMTHYYTTVMNYVSLASKYYNAYLNQMYNQRQSTTDELVLDALQQLTTKGDVDIKQGQDKRMQLATYFYNRARELWEKARDVFYKAQKEWFELSPETKAEVINRTRSSIDLSIFDTSFEDNPLFNIDPNNFGITTKKSEEPEVISSTQIPTPQVSFITSQQTTQQPQQEQTTQQPTQQPQQQPQLTEVPVVTPEGYAMTTGAIPTGGGLFNYLYETAKGYLKNSWDWLKKGYSKAKDWTIYNWRLNVAPLLRDMPSVIYYQLPQTIKNYILKYLTGGQSSVVNNNIIIPDNLTYPSTINLNYEPSNITPPSPELPYNYGDAWNILDRETMQRAWLYKVLEEQQRRKKEKKSPTKKKPVVPRELYKALLNRLKKPLPPLTILNKKFPSWKEEIPFYITPELMRKLMKEKDLENSVGVYLINAPAVSSEEVVTTPPNQLIEEIMYGNEKDSLRKLVRKYLNKKRKKK